MIHYNIFGNTKIFDFKVRGTVQKLMRAVCHLENIHTEHAISFIFVDNEEIHRINKEYRHIDRPTDVISFANIDSVPDRTLPYELGDIYISVDRLIEQANDFGHSIKREFAFLVTHGTLHLLGYDHMTKEDEKVMFKKQDDVLDYVEIYR